MSNSVQTRAKFLDSVADEVFEWFSKDHARLESIGHDEDSPWIREAADKTYSIVAVLRIARDRLLPYTEAEADEHLELMDSVDDIVLFLKQRARRKRNDDHKPKGPPGSGGGGRICRLKWAA